MSLALALLKLYLRTVQKPWLARVKDPAAARRAFERSARLAAMPAGALLLPRRVGNVPGLWVSCRPRGAGLILYFHGGAYVMGSSATHKAMVARLCALTGAEAFIPDYRLAPEHPFPAAFEDACSVWQDLLARGYRADGIVIGGDSAGGGLMLALLAATCRQGGPHPAAAFAFSPWTDLTLSGASLRENARADPLLPAGRVAEARDYYLAGADPADPRASPLLADFPGAPPVFLQAGMTEILRDDTTRMADRLAAQGVDVVTDLWPDSPHVLPIFQGWVPEADEALARAAAFIRQRLPAARASGS
ncbi:Acetyl esterase/lipase [Meinhardsimonia xiamenensis]|uniref:Acetyl esterase/lipase n=1 Tax=Meinhardsimonia xiamenensis TaxID=990712 RepID=A0A1G8ZDV3_9RHOB|nr:alpha/beta hydrolase [Meinhardsimonia xiamenensis]PRX37665.1 acetyl esterase/lipase [Meinhardsimonia xiamenensis]SDK13198.1 Acetyl esterase/lipase [Meinhardsimonia xiamenensis]